MGVPTITQKAIPDNMFLKCGYLEDLENLQASVLDPTAGSSLVYQGADIFNFADSAVLTAQCLDPWPS